ncbi:MAG: hypothetical protein Q8R12_00940 [bacterium]|nr:hypothetical protein [bacterium]
MTKEREAKRVSPWAIIAVLLVVLLVLRMALKTEPPVIRVVPDTKYTSEIFSGFFWLFQEQFLKWLRDDGGRLGLGFNTALIRVSEEEHSFAFSLEYDDKNGRERKVVITKLPKPASPLELDILLRVALGSVERMLKIVETPSDLADYPRASIFTDSFRYHILLAVARAPDSRLFSGWKFSPKFEQRDGRLLLRMDAVLENQNVWLEAEIPLGESDILAAAKTAAGELYGKMVAVAWAKFHAV